MQSAKPARWIKVGAFALWALGAGACESKTSCSPCMTGYYPSDPSQFCSSRRPCPEVVTDASASKIVIWCQDRPSQPDAARGEAGVDGLEPDNASQEAAVEPSR